MSIVSHYTIIRLFKAVIKCGILDSISLSIQLVKPGYNDMTHIDSVVVFFDDW